MPPTTPPTVATLEDEGVVAIDLWCVSNWPRCKNWRTVKVADLVRTVGPGTALIMVARRARCHECGRRGALLCLPFPRQSGQAQDFKYGNPPDLSGA